MHSRIWQIKWILSSEYLCMSPKGYHLNRYRHIIPDHPSTQYKLLRCKNFKAIGNYWTIPKVQQISYTLFQ